MFAYRVGILQAQILDKQSQLQHLTANRTLELEERKLRADLFDKRMEVYTATQAFIGVILAEGEPPSYARTGSDEEMARQFRITREFTVAIDRSQFLFGQHVEAELRQLWTNANDLHYHNVQHANDRPDDEEDHAQKARDLIKGFLTYDLNALMGDKLNIH
jgi:hypothetical protein